MNKRVWSPHAMEYYSTLKRKEILTQATAWMNLGDIMLSEISQLTERQTIYDSNYEVFRVVKIIKTESSSGGFKGLREGGNGELLFNGYRVSVIRDLFLHLHGDEWWLW